MKTKYYIITRFNCNCFPSRDDLQELKFDDEWLRERVRLFKTYCFPSVISQSFRNFTWIIKCHKDSPEWMKEELEAIVKNDGFRCISKGRSSGVLGGIEITYEDDYENYLDTSVDFLITTRLDNDDAIHRDYMLGVSNHMKEFVTNGFSRQLFTYSKGYRYFSNFGYVESVEQFNNPFLTLFADLSKNEKDKIVYCGNHGSMNKKFDTVYNNDLPAWCWIKHDTNTAGIAAKEIGRVPIKILSEFGVDYE